MNARTFITHSAPETQALGESWARDARPGWVIGLSGDLGAGKTQLVKGFARGLGFTGKVQSPTFALINEYKARLPVFHIDLYRLETREQIIGAGLEEHLQKPNGVVLVEWIERWLPELQTLNFQPQTPFRLVKIDQLSETERRVTYEDFGA